MFSILITCGHELAALGAARSLGRAGHKVTVALPVGVRAAVEGSRYVTAAVPSPNPWTHQHDFRRFLLAEAPKHDALLPISEAAIFATAQVCQDLGTTLLLMPPDHNLHYSLSKYHATAAAQAVGLPTPPTVFLSDPGGSGQPLQQREKLRSLGYPLLIKHDNFQTSDGRYVKGNTTRCTTELQALALLAELAERGAQTIAQTTVPGHGVGVFLLRFNGKIALRFAHRRLHEVPHTGGVSSLRVSIHDEQLLQGAERLLSHIGFEGVAMCEFRKPDTGPPRFLEINGRLWGSLALALHSGVDFPKAWLQLAQGATWPPQADYPDGVLCRNLFPGEALHLASVLRSAEVAPLKKIWAVAEQVALSLDRTVCHDHFVFDDLGSAKRHARLVVSQVFSSAQKRAARFVETRSLGCLLDRERRATQAKRARLASPRRILVMCLGNLCRSPFAQKKLQELTLGKNITVESAGFLSHMDRPTPARFVQLAQGFGVDLSAHRARRVKPSQVEAADLVLLMDAPNLRRFRTEFPRAIEKTFLIGIFAGLPQPEIPDPYLLPIDQAETSYRLLQTCCESIGRLVLSK